MPEPIVHNPQAFLRTLFDAAVETALPHNCLPPWLPRKPNGRVIVVGAGKAAASMASALEREWSGPLEGRVIVPYGHSADCQWIDVIEANHPVPDAAGVAAAKGILERVSGLSADDTVVVLISGGGSSLLCVPADGISLGEKQDITSRLLKSGAAIHEMNCVRKKLSAIKGGKLAAAATPANVLTLIISDIPGNDAAMVASGPTLADLNSPQEALDILNRFHVPLTENVRSRIEQCATANVHDSDVRVLASSDDALLAAAAAAAEANITPYSLGDISGDAGRLGTEHAQLALQIAAGEGPVSAPCVILSGGESAVEVTGSGRGGRNGQYALSLALALQGHASISAIACDTDGIDGGGDNAGCFVSPAILANADKLGLDTKDAFRRNDSYNFFSALDALITTGPTRTNVNDFRAILIDTEQH